MIGTPLEAAIAAAGGPAPFREEVGISVRTLASWRKHGVPDVRWAEVAAASRGAVAVQDLALDRARRLARPGMPALMPVTPEPA
jgi:hypothetical protein